MRNVFWIVLTFVFISLPCFAASGVKEEVKKGNLLYNKGKFEEALKKYEDAFLKDSDSEIVNFNLAAALYKLNDFNMAVQHFSRALITDDKSLQQRTNYNLGNAEYKLGINKEKSDLLQAIAFLKRALRHYEKAIELDEDDTDAKYNYEFVKKELERLKKRLKEQKRQEQRRNQKEGRKEGQPTRKEKQTGKQEEEKKAIQAEKKEVQKPGPQEPKRQEEQGEESRPATPFQDKKKEEEKKNPAEQPLPQGQIGVMSEEEARMILENYRQEEEPKGLYKEKIEKRRLQEVLKNW